MTEVPKLKISLCVDCARHPSLKRIIDQDSTAGLCAFCGRQDIPVRNPDRSEPMIMLIRSLIRYYYDEYEYNSHWGGNSVCSLLEAVDNPIAGPPTTSEYSDEFDEWLEWPPYPDWDKGVSVYAGHNDGVRGAVFAISRTIPSSVDELQVRLLTENFFEVEPDLTAMVIPFLAEISIELPVEEVLSRARLNYKATYQSYDGGLNRNLSFKPWLNAEIGAPPPATAGYGRLNRAGVSMLYLASDGDTALAEIRPHPGHYVSIGGFRSRRSVRLADFDPDIALFSSTDERLSLFAIIKAFDRLMSTPVTPDMRTPYLLTQLLAEVLLKQRFDGVRFRSSVSSGSNACIFHPKLFEFAEGFSEVRKVTGVRYQAPLVPQVIEPTADDILLKEN